MKLSLIIDQELTAAFEETKDLIQELDYERGDVDANHLLKLALLNGLTNMRANIKSELRDIRLEESFICPRCEPARFKLCKTDWTDVDFYYPRIGIGCDECDYFVSEMDENNPGSGMTAHWTEGDFRVYLHFSDDPFHTRSGTTLYKLEPHVVYHHITERQIGEMDLIVEPTTSLETIKSLMVFS